MIGPLGPRFVAAVLARKIRLRVEGLEHLPRKGPALVAARHYHHLYDGVALVNGLPRNLYLVVALDWARNARERRFMELVCGLAGWPVALRTENLTDDGPGAFHSRDALEYNRSALAKSVRLLRRGRVVAIFPEGYPTVDPAGARKPGEDAMLAFRPGVLSIAAAAQRDGKTRVPIVPAGLHYGPGTIPDVTLRLGAPLYVEHRNGRAAVLAELAESVRKLSSA